MRLENILRRIYGYGLESSMDMKDAIVQHELDHATKIKYIRNILSTYFNDCFIDGYYGDETYTEDYVNDLNKQIYSSLGNLKQFLKLDEIINRLPQFVWSSISVDGTFLAGGGALKVILDKKWEGDWDIYANSKAAKIIMQNISSSNIKCSNNTYGAVDVILDADTKVQVIVNNFKNPLEVLNKFDLTICQFAISRNIPCIYATEQAFNDLKEQSVDLNPRLFQADKEIINQRVDKYLTRGFKEAPKLREKIDNLVALPHKKSIKKKTNQLPGFAPMNDAVLVGGMQEDVEIDYDDPEENYEANLAMAEDGNPANGINLNGIVNGPGGGI